MDYEQSTVRRTSSSPPPPDSSAPEPFARLLGDFADDHGRALHCAKDSRNRGQTMNNGIETVPLFIKIAPDSDSGEKGSSLLLVRKFLRRLRQRGTCRGNVHELRGDPSNQKFGKNVRW